MSQGGGVFVWRAGGDISASCSVCADASESASVARREQIISFLFDRGVGELTNKYGLL